MKGQSNIVNLIRVIRPWQWTKNIFVLMPLFFGGGLTNAEAARSAAVTFAAFCFISSSIYCLNDIVDVEDDRRHPHKCRRPIAAGLITAGHAYAIMAAITLLSFATLLLLGTSLLPTLVVIAVYFVMNIAYCLRLKHYAIVDVCIIAVGFVLRVVAGGVATGIRLSSWIVLVSFLLSLFLAFAKRRDDVVRMNETGQAPRRNTSRYNLTFINQAITITGSVMVVCYIMYTVSPEVVSRFHTDNLYLTSILVVLGLLRYIQITVVDERSGDPTRVVLSDRATQLIILAWLLTFLFIIYLS